MEQVLAWNKNYRKDPVPDQNLFEQQIRHVFAHKRGRADASFVKRCPHLGYTVGKQIVINREHLDGHADQSRALYGDGAAADEAAASFGT